MNMQYYANADHSPEENGKTILEAIERCRNGGGGIVEIPAGTYRLASIRLYSDMTLHLASGAELLASENWQDYTNFHVPTTIRYLYSERVSKLWNLPPHYFNAFITAIEAENIAIIGEKGCLINGMNCFDPNGEEKFRGPMGMVFCRCRNVTLRGYTMRDSANWSHQIDSCYNVNIENVTILAGHDGFNVHHCENVRIDGCTITTGDDCIAGYDARNVYVTNCDMNTSCNGFRYGGENLFVDHCTFHGPGVYPHRVSGRHNMLYAFEYYSIAEDDVRNPSRNWLITNSTFRDMDGFLHYDFGCLKENQTNKPLLDMTVENFQIYGMKKTSTFHCNGSAPACLLLRHGTIDLLGTENGTFISTDEGTEVITEKVCVNNGKLQ
jgi:hypothetical protein